MDQWLNDGPGLMYVKELCTWVVVNNKAELISWTDDPQRSRGYRYGFCNTRQL